MIHTGTKKLILHFKIYTLIVLLSLLQFFCSPCIGRRILPEKTIEIEGFLTAHLGDTDASIPALPSLGVVLRYGLIDKITIGTTLNITSFALEGTVLMEPFAVTNLFKMNGNIPALNIYTGIPFAYFPKSNGIAVFPIVGICPNWRTDKFDVFCAYEASFDSKQFDNGVDIHSTCRLGGTFYPKPYKGIYAELGILNINRPSWINNSKNGLISVSIGYTHNISLKRK